ncbi:MAG: hypothetical protein H7336_13055 [Bacteriovorax sp.]|nr:hypothetical protein [Bacteriovorax sp.]
MKRYGHCALFLTFTVIFFSCDNNVTISQKSSHYDPRIHLRSVGANEKLPAGVRELLNQESAKNKMIPKFPLSYYLIQEGDVKFLRTKYFSPDIIEQLDSEVSGERYFKLFVHPDSDAAYTFLKHGYRYIGPEETEFFAAPVPGNKTVVVWNSKNMNKTAFIVKTMLDEGTIQEISTRFPASVIATPEMASLLFKRKIRGSSETIQGQQITAIPQF